MVKILREARFKLLGILPVLLLFLVSLNGSSVIHVKFFSINILYILVYFWVLRRPQNMGYGFIFLSGIISDTVLGVPLGVNPLALLVIATFAAYVRVVTVRITLVNDWISFIPALLFANYNYFISLYLSDFSIDYFYLLKNSLFTFIFYPILWGLFSLIIKYGNP